jgi:hypothetical protein
MKRILSVLIALTVTSVLAAAPSLTGNWTMNVMGGPHGDATMTLTLKQDGSKVTGTFVSGHAADMEVAGQFADGELKLETTAGNADSKILFSARLKDDGTLAGYISSGMGDMKWTATRGAEGKKK